MERDLNARSGEFASLFIRTGKAIAERGMGYFEALFEAILNAAGVDELLCAMADHVPFEDAIDDDEANFEECFDCGVPTVGHDEIVHAATCALNTDIWPVLPYDIAGELCCADCHVPFVLGECYKSLPYIRCLPCMFMAQST